MVIDDKSKNIRLTQVFKHQFNDSVDLKIESYQIFSNSESVQYAHSNQTTPEIQKIDSDIPIIIGFVNYNHKNRLGLTTAGLRYNNTQMKNQNRQLGQENPFSYTEQIFSGYLNHTYNFSETKSLGLGLRSESTAVLFEYENLLNHTQYKDRLNYTNLLYNINYNWYDVEAERTYSLAFRKEICRPNYSYLNPFKSIDEGITYQAGDYFLTTEKRYQLSFETYKSA